jgi:protein involved in polysaccharide export with SLBB domain
MFAVLMMLGTGPRIALADGDAGEYRLGPGDRLQILTFGRVDLSGTFEVRAPGIIAFPLLGNVDVRQRTPSEVERLISDKLTNEYQIAASVSVDIALYRPFYIVGDVMTPGKYTYAPGINVLQAVAIAGGYYSFRPSSLSAQLDAIRAEENYNIATTQQRAALLRRARLVAERENLPEVAVPDELAALQNDPHVQIVLATERQLFVARREGLDAEIALLEAQTGSFQKEITALKASLTAVVEQSRLMGLELQDAQSLLSKGLTQRPRVFELQRLVAGLTAEESQTRAFLARAEQNIGKVKQEIVQHRAAFREEVEQQLVDIETRLVELAQHRAAARDLMAAMLDGSSSPTGVAPAGVRTEFLIRRITDGREAKLRATEATVVLPDDVIEVPPLLSEDAPNEGAQPSEPGVTTSN